MIKNDIKLALEFHEKFGFQTDNCDLHGMLERNNLLLEELGEVVEVISLGEGDDRLNSELMDVYYILLGDLVAFGIGEIEVSEQVGDINMLIVNAGKLAQATRKYFDQDFVSILKRLVGKMIGIIQSLYGPELSRDLVKHHQKQVNKSTRIVAGRVVVSEFKQDISEY